MNTGEIISVNSNIVVIRFDQSAAIGEICHIVIAERIIPAEVIRITGNKAFAQVYAGMRGVKAGSKVLFTGSLLEIMLKPGLLGSVFDGLQNDLYAFEGLFLEKALLNDEADPRTWLFTPNPTVKRKLQAGDVIGNVKEFNITHYISIPFSWKGTFEVISLKPEGFYGSSDTLAVLKNNSGEEKMICMAQKWPVKIPLKAYREKLSPDSLLHTGIRCIDLLNPMAEGGTGFIPGAFGTGKTVLQQTLSSQTEADIIIMAACGERANEVIQMIEEFRQLTDMKSGKPLIEKSIIVCNTSSMPVASREASVYTAITMAEYYRNMGLKVLLLADSTSRWAQALREISNTLEELPGPEGYPVDISAAIAGFYARAGKVMLRGGNVGSISIIGTVSPAGGNLKEPVTEATKKVARCFYALSQARADQKRYPAVDPVDSYSKYTEYREIKRWTERNIHPGFLDLSSRLKNHLKKGNEFAAQISILGDDAVPVLYHTGYKIAELIDFVLLQQDFFDPEDKFSSSGRMVYMSQLIEELIEQLPVFDHFEEVNHYFTMLVQLVKQLNYLPFKNEKFNEYVNLAKNMNLNFQPEHV